jgi:hypothetical protein
MKPASLTRGEALHLPAVAGRITWAFERNQEENDRSHFDFRYFLSKRLLTIAFAKAQNSIRDLISRTRSRATGSWLPRASFSRIVTFPAKELAMTAIKPPWKTLRVSHISIARLLLA